MSSQLEGGENFPRSYAQFSPFFVRAQTANPLLFWTFIVKKMANGMQSAEDIEEKKLNSWKRFTVMQLMYAIHKRHSIRRFEEKKFDVKTLLPVLEITNCALCAKMQRPRRTVKDIIYYEHL